MKMILNNVKDRLLEAAVTEQNALVKAYGAGSYNEEKAAEMREAFGENKLSRHQNDSVLKRIFEAFVNPFTVILIVLALVSFVTDVMLAAPEEKDPVFVCDDCWSHGADQRITAFFSGTEIRPGSRTAWRNG